MARLQLSCVWIILIVLLLVVMLLIVLLRPIGGRALGRIAMILGSWGRIPLRLVTWRLSCITCQIIAAARVGVGLLLSLRRKACCTGGSGGLGLRLGVDGRI